MKYSIGYQLPDDLFSTVDICADHKEHISDVFFAFGNEPSGRAPLGTDAELEAIEAQQISDLSRIKAMGKKLTLLLNANCYGEGATSKGLRDHIISLCTRLYDSLRIDAVTVASPFVAEAIKAEFGSTLKVKASVNMRVGSVNAMRQLSPYFDGFYLKKELNRSFAAIESLKSWCDGHGKELYLLANSGCITDCAYQTFHDNAIAHQGYSNDLHGADFPAPCHRFIASLGLIGGLAEFIGSSWIRPEEIHLYEKYFDEVKLATRMHSRVAMIVSAYCRGRFSGNLLDLTEPSYSSVFKGYILDNTRVSSGDFERLFGCDKDCRNCGACERIASKALVSCGF